MLLAEHAATHREHLLLRARAPARSPCALSVAARLFMLVRVSGCSSPNTRRHTASTCSWRRSRRRVRAALEVVAADPCTKARERSTIGILRAEFPRMQDIERQLLMSADVHDAG